jgi:hypothetical protein
MNTGYTVLTALSVRMNDGRRVLSEKLFQLPSAGHTDLLHVASGEEFSDPPLGSRPPRQGISNGQT